MINSVSNVSFRGDATQDLINSPGRFTNIPAVEPDVVDISDKAPKKKSHKGAVIATALALLAAAYVGLGIAVGKGKLNLKVPAEGAELKFMEKVGNFFHKIGDSGVQLWNKVFNKKAAEAVENAAEAVAK